jgi:hypothetical protein
MSVAAWCHTVRRHWQAVTQLVWPESPQQRARAECQRLDAELARRHERLLSRRRRIERLRDALQRQERRLGQITSRLRLLAGRSEDARFGELAVALDQARQTAEVVRQRLQRQEEAYERQRVSFERKKQIRADLLAASAG